MILKINSWISTIKLKENNLKKIVNGFLIFAFISALIFSFSCSKKSTDSKISAPLVLRDGILFKDSLSTTPYSGRHKSRMLDQTIEYEVTDGIRNGDFIIYYPNGKVQMLGKMLDNKNTGMWKYYRVDGSLETEGAFENDLPVGLWNWFYPNGIIAETGMFNDGKRNGEWKNFDTSGTLISIVKYEKDKIVDSLKLN